MSKAGAKASVRRMRQLGDRPLLGTALAAGGDELFFVVGSETFLDLLTWREPRRVAARAAARRMAETLGERVGETVGYAMRLERRMSAQTRIEVITDGLLSVFMTTYLAPPAGLHSSTSERIAKPLHGTIIDHVSTQRWR